MNGDESVELHAIIYGVVQGVNFRYYTKRFAENLGITGTVRNVPDGTVEIVAPGPKDQLELLLSTLEGPEGAGRVDSKTVTFREANFPFVGFQILF